MAAGEMVLYYTPENKKEAAKLKGILVQMGVRIKMITQEQVQQKVGFLAGVEGFTEQPGAAADGAEEMDREIMVIKNFTGQRMSELFSRMRRAGLGRMDYKAVLTEQNVNWTFLELYREIKREHEAMHAGQNGEGNGQES